MHDVEHDPQSEHIEHDSQSEHIEKEAPLALDEVRIVSLPSTETNAGKFRPAHLRQYALVAGIVCVILAVIAAGVLSLWRQAPGPSARPGVSQTGPVPTLTPVTPAATPIRAPAWNGHSVNVTLSNGMLYAGTDDHMVYALHASDGKVQWRYKTVGNVAAPLVVDGIVYASANADPEKHSIYAFTAHEGRLLWQYNDGNDLYLSAVANGTVYVISYIADYEGSLVALDAKSGQVRWRYRTAGIAYEVSQVVNGMVYVFANPDDRPGSGLPTIYALQASDGSLRWQYTMKQSISRLTAAKDVIYAFSDEQVAALQASDGHLIWSQPIEGFAGEPLYASNGLLYFTATRVILEGEATPTPGASASAQASRLLHPFLHMLPAWQAIPHKEGRSSIYALRANDGKVLWHYRINEKESNWLRWLATENGVLYAGASIGQDKDYVYALQGGTGALLWQRNVEREASSALLDHGTIYVSSYDQAIYALRASDGSLAWSYAIDGQTFNQPVLQNSTLYVGAANGMLYALQASSGRLLWYYITDMAS